MNEHAIVVWGYLAETVLRYRGGGGLATDYQFSRLIFDMRNAYPDEFEYVLDNLNVEAD